MIPLLHHAIAPHRRTMRLGMVCAVLAAISAVGLLALSGWFLVGAALAGLAGPIAVQGFNYLLPSAAIRAAAIIRTGTRYGERMLGHRAALFALAQVRATLFGRVAANALTGRAIGRSGDMANRLGKDVDSLEDAVIRRVSRPGPWSAATAGLVAVVAAGWRAALILVLGMAMMRLAGRIMAARLLPGPLDRAAAAHAALLADYADMAGPSADIAIYGLAPAMATALARQAQTYDAARMELARAQSAITAIQSIMAVATVTLIAMVALASSTVFALGLLGAMVAMEAWGSLAQTDMKGHDLKRAQAQLASIEDHARPSPAQPPALPARPDLTLCGMHIAPGRRVLVQGPSGAGKTRLIETLAGLRHDAPQELAVAGYDPRDLAMVSLRSVFALASQDSPMIAGSIADNLSLARPGLSENDMWRALKTACVDDVVRGLPDGLQQWLGGDGARLSGGQKRRIVLARALLSDAPWLLLDEPSEGLDGKTEARLTASLDGWLKETGQGLVLISHRPVMAELCEGRHVLVGPDDTPSCMKGDTAALS